jgi:hypothetical protein
LTEIKRNAGSKRLDVYLLLFRRWTKVAHGHREHFYDLSNGNFMPQLEFLAKFDPVVSEYLRHLKNLKKKIFDTYRGKDIQNENIGLILSRILGLAIAQAVSRWLPTAAARVRARVWSSGICGGQKGAGAGFLRVLRFPLPIFIPPIAPQSSSSIIWACTIGQKWLQYLVT